jgi:hypothetical protein
VLWKEIKQINGVKTSQESGQVLQDKPVRKTSRELKAMRRPLGSQAKFWVVDI